MYKIWGKYENCPWEVVDEFATRREAELMLTEYRLAFGRGWLLEIRKGRTVIC